MKYCTINGEQQSFISIKDRGFAYGDGSFTTAKIIDGKVELLDAHINRLLTTCQHLNISCPTNTALKSQLTAVAKNYQLAVLKVVITAGNGGQGYARSNSSSANVIIIINDFPKHYFQWQQHGVTVGISEQLMGVNPMLAGFKHLNRLEQVLFKNELVQRKEDDLLITNVNGHLIEATSANLFWLYNGQWCTADLSLSGVAGLMRQNILNLLSMNDNGVEVVQSSIDILDKVQAMFICNTLMGIVPIKKINLPVSERVLSMDHVFQLQSKLNTLGMM